MGVAGLPHRNGNRQFAISGIGMIAPQVAIESGRALDWPGGPLVERDTLRSRMPVVISRSRWLSVLSRWRA